MRALVCRDLGDLDALDLCQIARPKPGPGEVLVEVMAAGVNFADTLMVAGRYQDQPEPPFVPGLELAGRIAELGPGLTDPAPAYMVGYMIGRMVMGLVPYGAFAEFALARAEDLFPLPDGMDTTSAAGLPVTYLTAQLALETRARLQPGETLLVHGAGGGAGLAAVEVGKALGASVIASARGADKLALAKAGGADHLIDTKDQDLRTAVLDITKGGGVDVVFDPIGGEIFDASLKVAAWGARLLVIGFAAGTVQQIPANHLLVKNVTVIGLTLGSFRKQAPATLHAGLARLADWYAAGKLAPRATEIFPLAEGGAALKRLAERRTKGKVVIQIKAD